MKTVVSRAVGVRVVVSLLICVGYCWLASGVLAQTNSWTNSASGNWEDSYWSLGVLPSTNQIVLLTNAGWKTLAIGPATSEIFPDTLTVDSVTISSPTNSFNTLLLNYAGTNTPLTVNSLTLGSNSAVTMLSSALFLNGPNSVGMQVGGEFNQNDSVVSGRQVNVGYIGPGIYNLNSGFFAVSNLWIGSLFAGVFNQNGGTNITLITDVEGGDYNLNNGYFNSTIYFNGGTFRQRGGMLENSLTIFSGEYVLENGIHYGSVEVPSPNGWGENGGGNVWQSGGTNLGDLDIGSHGIGSYTISNGVCYGGLIVDEQGSYTQWNGTLFGGSITIDGGPVYEKGGGGEVRLGSLELNGGIISCSSNFISGNYDQHNATNYVAGTLTIFGSYGHFFSDGMLCASNLTLELFNTLWAKAVFFDGTTIITNELLVYGGIPGFSGSGTLIVSNITLTSGAPFSFSGGTINQSGIISAANANINLSGPGPYHFGRLQLVGSNSVVAFFSPQCNVDFADSSGMVWSAVLTVKQWSGSLYGGGQQRIIFGTNSTALMPQQLSQIKFQNPAGLAPGNYPARILATGEIVPDTGAPLPPMVNLSPGSTIGAMHVSVGGNIGQTYAVEVSTDLVHWNTWTDQYNGNGSMSFDDNDATNSPQQFYRAHLMP